MNLSDLERHGQPLVQQEANLTYQRGQAKERLAEIDEELAKVRGKLELLRSLAEELAGDLGPVTGDRRANSPSSVNSHQLPVTSQ
jgi:small-conductance mechanosensitive channel